MLQLYPFLLLRISAGDHGLLPKEGVNIENVDKTINYYGGSF